MNRAQSQSPHCTLLIHCNFTVTGIRGMIGGLEDHKLFLAIQMQRSRCWSSHMLPPTFNGMPNIGKERDKKESNRLLIPDQIMKKFPLIWEILFCLIKLIFPSSCQFLIMLLFSIFFDDRTCASQLTFWGGVTNWTRSNAFLIFSFIVRVHYHLKIVNDYPLNDDIYKTNT